MNQIIEFCEFEAKMQEFKRQYDGVVYDLAVPEQEKKARSDRYTIGKVISALDERHKEIKAPLKEKVDLIDGERKHIKDELLDVQGKIKSQIDAHEAKIQAHQETLSAKVEALRLNMDNLTSISANGLATLRDNLINTVIDETYEDHKDEAEFVRSESVGKLDVIIAARVKYEADQVELEKLRKESVARSQAERDEKIRKEASERAQREAEEKAKREIEAAQRKQYEAEQAAKRAEQEARDKMEREQREATAKGLAKILADEVRRSKQKHRDKIENEVIQSLIACGFEDHAEKILSVLKDGKIKNVTINY